MSNSGPVATAPAKHDAGRPRGGAAATYGTAGVVLLAGALATAYALLLAWPMRIWHRPVSPHSHLAGTLGISREGALSYVLTVLLFFALYGAAL